MEAIADKLDAFIRYREAPFTLDEAASELAGNPSRTEIRNHLEEHDALFFSQGTRALDRCG